MSTSTSTKKQQRENERTEAIEALREMFPIGSTVSTILRHVSQSGMQRAISVLHIDERGNPRDVSWLVAKATGDKLHTRHEGIKVDGCGMDMGFALVYNLSRVLYRDSFHCNGNDGPTWDGGCPSNDHSNERKAGYKAGRLHSDGGYALSHRWV